jgi:Uma2 family endonuclease
MSAATTQLEGRASHSGFRTAEEWWESLGRVPMNRIVFDPLPGTATEHDLTHLDDHEDRLCELVDGTLVEKAMGLQESLIAGRIIYLLSLFVVPRKLGLITSPDGMLRILANRVRIPDVAFISFAKLPGQKLPQEAIPSLVPDLAVEVISESNTRSEMNLKLEECFSAGLSLVWYVDPKGRCVDVYTAADRVQRISENELLTGGNVLPGFQTAVSAVFDVAP